MSAYEFRENYSADYDPEDVAQIRLPFEHDLAYVAEDTAKELTQLSHDRTSITDASWFRKTSGHEAESIFYCFPSESALSGANDRQLLADDVVNDMAGPVYQAIQRTQSLGINYTRSGATPMNVHDAADLASSGLVNQSRRQYRAGLDELKRVKNAADHMANDHAGDFADYDPESVEEAMYQFHDILTYHNPETALLLKQCSDNPQDQPHHQLNKEQYAAIWEAFTATTNLMNEADCAATAYKISEILYHPVKTAAEDFLNDPDQADILHKQTTFHPESLKQLLIAAAYEAKDAADAAILSTAQHMEFADVSSFTAETGRLLAANANFRLVTESADTTQVWTEPQNEYHYLTHRAIRTELMTEQFTEFMKDRHPDYKFPEQAAEPAYEQDTAEFLSHHMAGDRTAFVVAVSTQAIEANGLQDDPAQVKQVWNQLSRCR